MAADSQHISIQRQLPGAETAPKLAGTIPPVRRGAGSRTRHPPRSGTGPHGGGFEGGFAIDRGGVEYTSPYGDVTVTPIEAVLGAGLEALTLFEGGAAHVARPAPFSGHQTPPRGLTVCSVSAERQQ